MPTLFSSCSCPNDFQQFAGFLTNCTEPLLGPEEAFLFHGYLWGLALPCCDPKRPLPLLRSVLGSPRWARPGLKVCFASSPWFYLNLWSRAKTGQTQQPDALLSHTLLMKATTYYTPIKPVMIFHLLCLSWSMVYFQCTKSQRKWYGWNQATMTANSKKNFKKQKNKNNEKKPTKNTTHTKKRSTTTKKTPLTTQRIFLGKKRSHHTEFLVIIFKEGYLHKHPEN